MIPAHPTPAVTDRILEGVLGGGYLQQAAESAGVTLADVEYWVERGRNHPDDLACAEFARKLDAASAAAELAMVAVVKGAASVKWEAAAWWLERRHASRWSRAGTRGTAPPDPEIEGDKFAEVDSLAAVRQHPDAG